MKNTPQTSRCNLIIQIFGNNRKTWIYWCSKNRTVFQMALDIEIENVSKSYKLFWLYSMQYACHTVDGISKGRWWRRFLHYHEKILCMWIKSFCKLYFELVLFVFWNLKTWKNCLCELLDSVIIKGLFRKR